MTRKNQNKLFKEICDKYNQKLHIVEDEDWSSYGGDVEGGLHDMNCSYAFGDVFVGLFEDEHLEERLLGFFHEIGHIDDIISKRNGKWETWDYYHFNESSAWKTGINIAKEYGIVFSDEALAWAKAQLSSYFQEDPPNHEKTDIKFLPQALEEAFG